MFGIHLILINFEDFYNYYWKKGVLLLLSDPFEKFISTSLKYYNLDPCHYFSAPGLSYVKNDKNRIRKK